MIFVLFLENLVLFYIYVVSMSSNHTNQSAYKNNLAAKFTRHNSCLSTKHKKNIVTWNKRNISIGEAESLFYRKQETKVNQFEYKLLIRGEKICSNDTGLVIVVNSHPSHVEQRLAIRSTWAGAAISQKWPNRTLSLNIR